MNIYKICGFCTVVLVIIFVFQNCDLTQTSKEESFQNPYTEQTNQAFHEVSDAVFGNIDRELKAKRKSTSSGSLSREDIMRYASEGYAKWAKKNGINVTAFQSGADFSAVQQVVRKKKGKASPETMQSSTDTILAKTGFTELQRNYILQLPEIVQESENIAALKQRLQHFDEKVYNQLGEEDSKAVLKMSALMLGSIDFLTTNAKALAVLTSITEGNDNQKWFSYKSKKSGYSIPKLKSGCLECSSYDPPKWDNYYSKQDLGFVIVTGAAAGTIVFGEAGPKIGLLFGPGGATIGGAVGALIGFGAGAAGAGGYYHENRKNRFEEAIKRWCKNDNNKAYYGEAFHYDVCYGGYY